MDKGGDNMTEMEFRTLKKKLLQQLGLINSELRRGQQLDAVLDRCGVKMSDLELIGWGYNEESNQVGKFMEVTFDDIEEQEQEEEVHIVSIVDNRTPLSTLPANVDLEQFQGIMNNYSVLMEMIERYKQNNIGLNSEDRTIIIELPIEEDKQFKKTFRINKTIFEQFEGFCKEHQEYTVKDLVSMALKEYMDRHR